MDQCISQDRQNKINCCKKNLLSNPNSLTKQRFISIIGWQGSCSNSCSETEDKRSFITCSSTIQNTWYPWSSHQRKRAWKITYWLLCVFTHWPELVTWLHLTARSLPRIRNGQENQILIGTSKVYHDQTLGQCASWFIQPSQKL